MKSYFGQLKHKKIIDPTDDSQLDKLTEDIEDLFIKPYKNKMQMQLNWYLNVKKYEKKIRNDLNLFVKNFNKIY